MMIVQIVDQSVIFVSETRIHEERFPAAGKKCAVTPDIRVSVIDRCDLHVSACGLCAKDWCDGTESEEKNKEYTDDAVSETTAMAFFDC